MLKRLLAVAFILGGLEALRRRELKMKPNLVPPNPKRRNG
jgi:hypothetical protein